MRALVAILMAAATAATPAVTKPALAKPVPGDSLPDSPSSLDADLVERRTRVFDFEDDVIGDIDIVVEDTLGLEPGDIDLLRSPPTNPRIIDIDLMHRRDCALDRVHGGQCVLRGFDEPAEHGIDVDRYARDRAMQGRIDALDRILETADELAP